MKKKRVEFKPKGIGKQRPYISRIENGEDLRLSNLLQISTALGLNLTLTINYYFFTYLIKKA
ncbi:MAG: helix-turn-helix domain-containing protein [Chitinophagales bacterium]